MFKRVLNVLYALTHTMCAFISGQHCWVFSA